MKREREWEGEIETKDKEREREIDIDRMRGRERVSKEMRKIYTLYLFIWVAVNYTLYNNNTDLRYKLHCRT